MEPDAMRLSDYQAAKELKKAGDLDVAREQFETLVSASSKDRQLRQKALKQLIKIDLQKVSCRVQLA